MATRQGRAAWRKGAGAIAAIAAMLLAAAGASAQQDPVVLKFHHFLGPTSSAHANMIQPWADRVRELSGGRIEIEIYPSMTLGGRPAQLIRQVRDGVADLVWTVTGYTPGQFPRTEVFELPFVHTNNVVATNLAMRELFDAWLAEEYADVHVVLLHVHAGNAIHTVDRPVRSVEDMRGLKMRIPTRTGGWVLEALGSSPVGMPVPELPQALSRKAVDGALIPFEIIPALKIHDLTRYQIEGEGHVRLGTITFVLAMNRQRYEALPLDLRKAIDASADAAFAREVGMVWTGSEREGIALALASGNELITLPEDEVKAFEAKLEPVVERWIGEVEAQGIAGRELVRAAREAIARHARDGNPWDQTR